MQIFLDTADVESVKAYVRLGIIDGVTTNPSLMAKEGKDPKEVIMQMTKIVDGPISCEVVAEDAETMFKQAEKVSAWHKNIYAKIPLTAEGIRAVKMCTEAGIKTNVTLCFSLNQALMAAKAGATLVSPFVGRLDDVGEEGMDLIRDIVEAYNYYGYETKVLAASLRHPHHVRSCILAGADIVTIPPQILDKMVKHPLTDKGLASFNTDWENCEACKSLYT